MVRLLFPCFLLASLTVLGQGGIQISNELDGIITTSIREVQLTQRGNAVIVQQTNTNNIPAPDQYQISLDSQGNAKASLLPHAHTSPGTNKEFLLATLSDGSILTANASKSSEFSPYSNPKKLQNIYITVADKRRLLWKGEVSLINHKMISTLTPDQRNFIWHNQGKDTRMLRIDDGSVKTLDPAIATLQSGIFSERWAVTNDYLLVCGKTADETLPYTMQLIDLKTGLLKDQKKLPDYFVLRAVGDSLVYTLNATKGVVYKYNFSQGSLVQQQRYKVNLSNLPIAYSRHGAPYSFLPLPANKLLIYPTSPLDAYLIDQYNPGLFLYDLEAGKIEKVWPNIMKGSADHTPAYLAFKPRVIVEDTAAVVSKPLNSAERCEQNNRNQKWPVGTCFQKGKQRCIIVRFDCYYGSYVVADMTWNSIGKYWATSTFNASEQSLTFRYDNPVSKKFGLCQLCNATGVLNKKKTYTRASRVVLLNFTDYVRTPAYELETWEKETCDVCKGEAWIAL